MGVSIPAVVPRVIFSAVVPEMSNPHYCSHCICWAQAKDVKNDITSVIIKKLNLVFILRSLPC